MCLTGMMSIYCCRVQTDILRWNTKWKTYIFVINSYLTKLSLHRISKQKTLSPTKPLMKPIHFWWHFKVANWCNRHDLDLIIRTGNECNVAATHEKWKEMRGGFKICTLNEAWLTLIAMAKRSDSLSDPLPPLKSSIISNHKFRLF